MSLGMSVTSGRVTHFTCSYCGVLSQFNPNAQHYSQIDSRFYEISQCQNQSCKKFMVFVYDTQGMGSQSATYTKIFHYPTSLITVDQSVPADIANSYIQGVDCLNVNAPIGSITCFRRALQQVCKEKGAKKQDLNEQIDEILPTYLREQAHEIRLWGNIGAHPDKLIKDVKKEDAEEIKDLLDSIFEALYITPNKVQQRRNKRKKTL